MEKVSIIITTYKGDLYLSRAIDSALNQSYCNVEIIVVDDNNPNSIERIKTEQIMKQYEGLKNILYIQHNENLNGAVARNTGIKASTGKYITFLDDDDFFANNRIEKCVQLLQLNPQYQAIYTSVSFDFHGKNTGILHATMNGNLFKELLLNENLLGTGSNIFVLSEIFEKLVGFNEKYIRNQDYEFMLRFFRFYEIFNLDEVLVTKSVNGVNNIPKFREFYEVKQMIFRDFKNEISLLSQNERDLFITNNLYSLLNAAYIHKNIKDINCVEKMYRNLGYKLGMKNHIRKFVYIIGLYDILKFFKYRKKKSM